MEKIVLKTRSISTTIDRFLIQSVVLATQKAEQIDSPPLNLNELSNTVEEKSNLPNVAEKKPKRKHVVSR